MITVELAVRLRAAGLVWEPQSGDRFAIPDRQLDGEVFVVSEMTIEAARVGAYSVLKFNGTTEWALDSVDADDVVWLPHEAQLRARLGAGLPGPPHAAGGLRGRGRRRRAAYDGIESLDAECAYARALLVAARRPLSRPARPVNRRPAPRAPSTGHILRVCRGRSRKL